MKFSLIIPAKNEEKRIILPLVQYYFALQRAVGAKKFEIIVVVNNTTDKTIASIKELKQLASMREIKIVNLKHCEGKGQAVLHGFTVAKGDIIGFIDADGSSSHEELAKMYHVIEQEESIDAVIASRYTEKGQIIGGRQFHRKIASKILHTLIKIMFNAPIEDFFCGLKLFRKRVVTQLLENVFIYGWAFDVNMLIHLYKNGFTIKEVPTTWTDRTNSKVRVLGSGTKVLRELFSVYARYNHFYRPVLSNSEVV